MSGSKRKAADALPGRLSKANTADDRKTDAAERKTDDAAERKTGDAAERTAPGAVAPSDLPPSLTSPIPAPSTGVHMRGKHGCCCLGVVWLTAYRLPLTARSRPVGIWLQYLCP